MKKILCVWMLLLLCLALGGQDMEGVLVITGADSEENLSSQVMERFEYLADHPVQINLYGRQRLVSCGLFSLYQVATLLDYRARHGDVLSIEELSTVDGFGKELAYALAPYISLSSMRLPGDTSEKRVDNSLTLRHAVVKGKQSFRGKYILTAGERASAAVAVKKDSYTLSAAYYGKRHPFEIIAGDYNARFGQGLTLWSGFSMSGMSAPSSLYRRATGIRPSSSYSDTGLRGVAGNASIGHFALSSFLAFPGLRAFMDGKSAFSKGIMPGANVSWYLRIGQLSATAVYRKGEESVMLRTGLDGRFCIKGIDVFAEVAYGMQDKGEDTGRSSEIAVIGGTVIPLGKSLIGVYARLFPSDFPKDLAGAVRSGTSVRDESGLSLSFQRKSMTFCADYSKKLSTSRNQLKLTLKDEIPVGKVFSIKPRAVVRLRSGAEDARVDVRSDFVLGTGPWINVLRGEWLRCEEDAFLTYYESGYKIDEFSVYGRATFFRVDRWADRIYAYQRDAPGNFNVPAYYGRGYGLDLYTAWKKSLGRFTRLKLYFRAYMLSYPWTKMSGQAGHDGTRKKPGKGGLSFQVAFDF